MEHYRKLVKRLADEGSSDLIPNGGTEHAEVLIENIFLHARDVVRVFSGELNARVYGASNIVENAKEFMQSGSGKKLQILIQDYSYDDHLRYEKHDLIHMCYEKLGSDACEIKAVDDIDKVVDSHFVVMDDIGYRFEPDRKKPAAIGCFNDPEMAQELIVAFDKMFERGKPLDFSPAQAEAQPAAH